MSDWSSGGKFRFFAAALTLWSLLSLTCLTGFAQVCPASAKIDQVPFFIEQIYHDVLDRAADAEGQRFHADQLRDLNARACQSRDPMLAATGCEWNNNARVVLDMLGSAESVSKNGSIQSNDAFVSVLYKTLLRRRPDGLGLPDHVRVLDSGGTRLSVVLSFLTSDEYRNRFGCNVQAEAHRAGGHLQLGVNGHPIRPGGVYAASNGVSFDQQFTLIKNLGADWYRVDITIPDFSVMDVLLQKAQAHGIQLLPVIFPVIDRDHDSPSTIYQKSYDSAFKFASHYKGSIQAYELSNEQDAYSLTGGPGDQVSMYDARKYGIVSSMLRGLSEGVHAGDPSAKRIVDFSGWLHTGFFQRVENDHIAYEIVGVHWYGNMGEINCPGQSYPCPSRLQHFNVVQRLQSITHGKPMWVTEINYSPLPNRSEEQNGQQEQQYLVATLQRFLTSPTLYPFEVVFIYELLDEPGTGGGATQTEVGLVSVTPQPSGGFALGSPKSAYEAVQRLFKH